MPNTTARDAPVAAGTFPCLRGKYSCPNQRSRPVAEELKNLPAHALRNGIGDAFEQTNFGPPGQGYFDGDGIDRVHRGARHQADGYVMVLVHSPDSKLFVAACNYHI